MKKIVTAILLTTFLVGAATAQHHVYRGAHYRYGPKFWHSTHGWVWPSIVGGVVVYEIIKNGQPQRVIIEHHDVIGETNCTEWKEIQLSDGKVYRERTCKQN